MSSASSFDPDLIDQTRQQLRTLVHEIEGLSRSELSPGEFYEGFLTRIVSALAAVGGAIWTLDEGGLKLSYQMNLQQARLGETNEEDQQRHGRLLHKVAADGQGLLVQPHSGEGESGEAANPTEYLLVIGALKSDTQVQGIVEIFQRPGGRPTVERGYLRFLQQMCDLAGDYLKTRHLRSFADRQVMWSQLEQFTRLVHEGLDPRQTAYTIANEGRRLIGCDRVSVALERGGRCRIEAISGQELLDNRSNTVTLLGKLATIVVAGGEDLWYNGDTSNLPPQIEESVETYADESHSKMVAVLPLERPRDDTDAEADENAPPEFLGALIIEQIADDAVSESMRRRIDVVADHSALALANAREHNELFLMPVWRLIGKSRWMVAARTLPKTLAISGAILVALLVLFLWPMKFQLSGKGTLEPAERRDVFAPVKGTVTKIHVQHGDLVEPGQLLLTLYNNDIEQALTETEGKLSSTREQRLGDEQQLLGSSGSHLSREEYDRISGQVRQYRSTEDSLDSQLKLLREKKKLLEIRSPIKGQVVTWQINEKLLQRPVEEGQLLLTVADPTGQWELDVLMPEDRHGLRLPRGEREAPRRPMPVSCGRRRSRYRCPARRLLHPGDQPGHAASRQSVFHRALGPRPRRRRQRRAVEGGHRQIRARPGRSAPGATVTAKVDCGTASVGYCWFHDVISFVQSRILFRLW